MPVHQSICFHTESHDCVCSNSDMVSFVVSWISLARPVDCKRAGQCTFSDSTPGHYGSIDPSLNMHTHIQSQRCVHTLKHTHTLPVVTSLCFPHWLWSQSADTHTHTHTWLLTLHRWESRLWWQWCMVWLGLVEGSRLRWVASWGITSLCVVMYLQWVLKKGQR